MMKTKEFNNHFFEPACIKGGSKGGLWGLETPFQSVSYSKVSASINYFIGAMTQP